MNKNDIIIFSIFLFIGGYIIYKGSPPTNQRPVPTEFLEQKKNKKEFKKHRKEFYEHMHQSDSNVNWREIDKKTRKEKTDNSKIILESMLDEGQLSRENLSS